MVFSARRLVGEWETKLTNGDGNNRVFGVVVFQLNVSHTRNPRVEFEILVIRATSEEERTPTPIRKHVASPSATTITCRGPQYTGFLNAFLLYV